MAVIISLLLHLCLCCGAIPIYRNNSPLESFISSDGKYGCNIDKQTGEMYFSTSYEEDITVLRIPDEIDGHPIVGVYGLRVESPYITKIVFGKNIKKVYSEGLVVTTGTESKVPFCSMVLNEGLERILTLEEYSVYSKKMECPFLILPKSLLLIGEAGIDTKNYENIVFQSSPITLASSVIAIDEGEKAECSVYLTESAEQMDVRTFHHYNSYIDYQIDEYIHIYGNGDSYPFPVEKYAENFWENIKETEKVTLDESRIEMKIGDTANINANIYPTDAYDGRVFYVSLDEETASVDSEGKITALKDGAATIRVVAASGAYADCTVTVGNSAIQTEKSMNIKLIFVCALVADVALIIVLIFVFKKR